VTSCISTGHALSASICERITAR